MNFSRRAFLGSLSAQAMLMGCKPDEPFEMELPPGTPDPFEGGEFLESIPFNEEVSERPFGEKYNVGWDARLRYDLARVDADGLETPNPLFYIRTENPDLLDTSEADWRIAITGLVGAPSELSIADLRPLSQAQGSVLLECSGNTYHSAFGLLSSATWSGVPLSDVLDTLDIDPSAVGVLVRGFDSHSVPSVGNHSTPGAAWVFTFEQIEQYAPFLALEMNGEALPPDHGYPVRLVMPRWYGCSNIKWVDEIRLIDLDEPATGQMVEFASRTHQPAPTPTLARDFEPANMEHSAVPVRVERWLLDGEEVLRIIGIHWGGEQSGDLTISLNGTEEPLTLQAERSDTNSWGIWVHQYTPAEAGELAVRMSLTDGSEPTFRLDTGWYDRAFTV